MSKEYVFVGRAQLKTRDYIYQIENENRELNQEIERLNKIIDEFNKLIENEINESKLEEDYDRVDAMEYCLAILQELKVDDKE